jgi:hypothetical protein
MVKAIWLVLFLLIPVSSRAQETIDLHQAYDQAVLDWLRRMDEWARANAVDEARRDQAIQDAVKQVYEQNERIHQDETQQHKAQQEVGSGGVNYTEIFKFLGKYVAPAVAALLAGLQMSK